MRRLLLSLVLVGAACETYVASESPGVSLVEIGSGVYAVADSKSTQPVFFADDFYWRYSAGRWYRSTWYAGSWERATPPPAVAAIEDPYHYVHYRPGANEHVAIRDQRGQWHYE